MNSALLIKQCNFVQAGSMSILFYFLLYNFVIHLLFFHYWWLIKPKIILLFVHFALNLLFEEVAILQPRQ